MKSIPRLKAARSGVFTALLGVMASVLSACSSVPLVSSGDEFRSTAITMPDPPAANGSIFQNGGAYMLLFEDRRPQRVGDLLTIVLNERANASKNSASTANRSASASLLPNQLPKGLEDLALYGFDLEGASDFSGGGGAQANNQLTGTITVTVADVLANGNFRVVGEKEIMINQGTEFIRFSGVVNPRTINGQNAVQSSEVFDARIQYTGKGYASEAQRMGWLQRLFLTVAPF
jgi:flagellar L-ring protein precursor FlgH